MNVLDMGTTLIFFLSYGALLLVGKFQEVHIHETRNKFQKKGVKICEIIS